MDEPSPDQVEAYRADGFVIVPDYLPFREVEATRARFDPLFAHEWSTGVAPDEVNYTAGTTAPDRTRQLCNAWRADPVIASTVRSARHGRFAAALEGAAGMRLLQDNVLWKPPGGRAVGAHRDNAYNGWLDPVNMTTCWMALDDTSADGGTIYYVRGSHRWPPTEMADNFHAPDDWLAHARTIAPQGVDLEALLEPVEVPAGGAAFHHGWTLHGSPPSRRADRSRRSLVAHLGRLETHHHPAQRHPVYSRYLRPGSLDLPAEHFPPVWPEDYGDGVAP
ncbi:MAG: phytanoyl-CoA dioxygenase family protein [Ilumatobacteraceae bacterium]